MTSNLGSKAIQENDKTSPQGIGFAEETEDTKLTKYAQLCHTVGESLKTFFKPEFLNRIDEIIVFEQLTKSDIREIANIMVKDLIQRVKSEKDITLSLTPRMLDLLIEEGFNPIYGARPLRRALVKLVEDKVSLEYLRYQNDQDEDTNSKENQENEAVDILVDVEFNKVKVSITRTVKKNQEEKPKEEIPVQERKKYKIVVPSRQKTEQSS
ncbi:unnamed protein product [Laminaria digitata]